MSERPRVLLAGATGFVGSHVHLVLTEAGFDVVGGSRDPEAAERRFAGRRFRRLNLDEPDTVEPALSGCDMAVYLVHGMKEGHGDYAERELAAARCFREAASTQGVRRIVYLGGVEPAGKVSRHLQSRLQTGVCLRSGQVPTLELQATMVVGAGSESFRMVRDLAARLPWMLLPRWAQSQSEPIAVADVVFAICQALLMPDVEQSRVYGLPGPERLTAEQILRRTARLLGRHPRMFRVPLLTPRLSSYWIRMVTRAHPHVATELVQGLTGDLLAPEPSFWALCPEHTLQGFDEAVRMALLEEQRGVSISGRLLEQAMSRWDPEEPST